MNITVRGKNLEVTPALRDHVEKNVSKLGRYFDSDMKVQTVLSVEKENRIAEVTCFVEGIVLRGVDSNIDMYAAIDLVVDKLVRQIHKHKTRLAKRFKQANIFRGDLPEFKETETIQEEAMDIVRRKKFDVRPMMVEEAILQMNLIGHDFFMFFNEETENINVVYRRKNGAYGLIEPNF